MRQLLFASLIVMSICTAGQLKADSIVYNTGTFNPGTGGDITIAAWANDFSFSQPTTFDTLRFWAFSSPNGDQTFSGFSGTIGWAVHQDIAGAVGPVLFSGASTNVLLTNTGIDGIGGSRIFQLDVFVGELSLNPGTYWWQFREGPVFVAGDGTNIGLVGTGLPAHISGLRIDLDEVNPTFPGNAIPVDIAFQLRSTISEVPEPASLALWSLMSVAGLAAWRRRRRANVA